MNWGDRSTVTPVVALKWHKRVNNFQIGTVWRHVMVGIYKHPFVDAKYFSNRTLLHLINSRLSRPKVR